MDRGRSTKAGKSLLRKTTMKGEFAKKVQEVHLEKKERKKKGGIKVWEGKKGR